MTPPFASCSVAPFRRRVRFDEHERKLYDPAWCEPHLLPTDVSSAHNIWLTVSRGPTDDKPEVVASPRRDPNVLSIFLNLRVTDIRHHYDPWSLRGAKFITARPEPGRKPGSKNRSK